MNTSDDQLRVMIDTIPALAWSAACDGSIEFLNRTWLDYTGFSSDRTPDSTWTLAVHPDDLSKLTDYWRSIRASGEPGEIELRLRRFDGEYRWFLCRVSPLRDELGKLVKWYGINADIDDRKRAEEALRASEQSFRLIVDSIPGLVCTATAEGEVELVNRQLLEFFGKPLEELKGWATSDAVHPADLPRVHAAWRESVETGQPLDIEHRIRRADGVYRWFHGRAFPVQDPHGRVIRWYSLLFDVDERKRVEEKLRRNEWNLLEAQRLGHSGSWSLDVASGIVASSPEIIRVFAPGPDEDYFRAPFFFNRIHPEDRKRVHELFERCVMEKTNYEADFRLLLPDGTIKYQHSIGYPILNESGELVEFIGTAIDTTQQNLSKIELEKAFEKIECLKDQLYKENIALREEIDKTSMFEEIVGGSPALQAVLSRVAKVAPTDSTVLITGETGTGKELIARAIHKRSHRSGRAFVSVNCAALAPSLISSELFGHEKGAFTGATQRRLGRFELADGGTIFLDEVGELPPDTQVALLRVLQEREFERVGGTQSVRVDVRVITASNRNLGAAAANGTFRPDLFYRLNVFPIEVPPLRKRKEDIVMLLEYFVRRFARKVGKTFGSIDKRTLELFRSYDWPGNIRELQNVVERSVIVSPETLFCVDEAWLSTDPSRVPLPQPASEWTDEDESRERQIIEAALAESRGRVSGPKGAAAKLRIPPSSLEFKIKKLKIPKSHFKLS
jgi:PAS domain S-box-containing protein